MEVVFGSIIFDSNDKMVTDFFDTLKNQDTDDFDILLINDHFPKDKLDKILDKYNTLKDRITLVDVCGKQTFYENRCMLIKQAKEKGYDLLVRGDFDDVYANDKVSSYIKQFDDNYAFFYNDIYVNNQSIFEVLPDACTDFKQIGQYNFVGEGACAINLHHIDTSLLYKLGRGKTNVFDWYLFTTLLLANLKGKRIDSGYTFYNLYDGNMAGVPSKNLKTINREIEIKRLHYSLLKDQDDYFLDLYEKYMDDVNINITNDLDKYYWWGFTYVD